MNILNKPKNTDNEDLKEFENPDYYRNKQEMPINSSAELPVSQEEMDTLLSGLNSDSQSFEEVNSVNNQAENVNSPQQHNSVASNSAGQTSDNQKRIYIEDDWNGNDSDFEESVQGTMYQQSPQGFHSPQITFTPQNSQSQTPQPKENPPASPPPSFNSLQQPTPPQTFFPPPDLSKQAEAQQNMQMPYQPRPQEQPLNFSPLFSDFSDEDSEEKSETLLTPKKVGILGAIKEFINKRKTTNKEKAHKSQPKKKKDTDNDDKKSETDPKKYALLVLLLFILAGVGYFVFSMMAPGLFATNNGAQPNKNNNQKKKTATILVEDRSGNIPQNPFVAKSQVAALAIVEGVYPKKAQGNQPVVAGSHPVVVPQNVPRFTPPAIPKSSPAPPVSRLVPPAVPKGASPTPAGQSAVNSAPKLTGIIESDNGAVAVMSDGTVVSSGDTYNDGRIAYIGGDGIHFDNGKSITFEE